MSAEKLCEAAKQGDLDEVARLLDEEGVEVDSMDGVSVCVLCLLILVLFGIVWIHCGHEVFSAWSLGCIPGASGSRSEPVDQD